MIKVTTIRIKIQIFLIKKLNINIKQARNKPTALFYIANATKAKPYGSRTKACCRTIISYFKGMMAKYTCKMPNYTWKMPNTRVRCRIIRERCPIHVCGGVIHMFGWILYSKIEILSQREERLITQKKPIKKYSWNNMI